MPPPKGQALSRPSDKKKLRQTGDVSRDIDDLDIRVDFDHGHRRPRASDNHSVPATLRNDYVPPAFNSIPLPACPTVHQASLNTLGNDLWRSPSNPNATLHPAHPLYAMRNTPLGLQADTLSSSISTPSQVVDDVDPSVVPWGLSTATQPISTSLPTIPTSLPTISSTLPTIPSTLPTIAPLSTPPFVQSAAQTPFRTPNTTAATSNRAATSLSRTTPLPASAVSDSLTGTDDSVPLPSRRSVEIVSSVAATGAMRTPSNTKASSDIALSSKTAGPQVSITSSVSTSLPNTRVRFTDDGPGGLYTSKRSRNKKMDDRVVQMSDNQSKATANIDTSRLQSQNTTGNPSNIHVQSTSVMNDDMMPPPLEPVTATEAVLHTTNPNAHSAQSNRAHSIPAASDRTSVKAEASNSGDIPSVGASAASASVTSLSTRQSPTNATATVNRVSDALTTASSHTTMSSQMPSHQVMVKSEANTSSAVVIKADPRLNEEGVRNIPTPGPPVQPSIFPTNARTGNTIDSANIVVKTDNTRTQPSSNDTSGSGNSSAQDNNSTRNRAMNANTNAVSAYIDETPIYLPDGIIKIGKSTYVPVRKMNYSQTPSANPFFKASNNRDKAGLINDYNARQQLDILEHSPFPSAPALPLWMTCNCAYPYGYPTDRRLAVEHRISELQKKNENSESPSTSDDSSNRLADCAWVDTTTTSNDKKSSGKSKAKTTTATAKSKNVVTPAAKNADAVPPSSAVAVATRTRGIYTRRQPPTTLTDSSTVAAQDGTEDANEEDEEEHEEEDEEVEEDIKQWPEVKPIIITGKMSFDVEIADVYVSDLISTDSPEDDDKFRSLSQFSSNSSTQQSQSQTTEKKKQEAQDFPHSAKVCQCGIWGPRNQHNLDAICNIDTELWAHNSDVYVFVPEASPFDDEFGLVITSTTARARNMRGKMMCRGFGSMALRTLFMERSRKMRKLAKETRKRKRNSEYDDDDDLVLPSDSRSASSPISSANTEVDMIYIRLHANTVSELKALDSLHSEQRHLLRALYHNHNVFLTGGAGTGKSHLIRTLTSKLPVRVQVTATTGMAAIGVGGITIHSLSKIELGYGVAKDIARKVCLLI